MRCEAFCFEVVFVAWLPKDGWIVSVQWVMGKGEWNSNYLKGKIFVLVRNRPNKDPIIKKNWTPHYCYCEKDKGETANCHDSVAAKCGSSRGMQGGGMVT